MSPSSPCRCRRRAPRHGWRPLDTTPERLRPSGLFPMEQAPWEPGVYRLHFPRNHSDGEPTPEYGYWCGISEAQAELLGMTR